jgi:undecaprenyl diphosphate synthase
MSDHGVKHLAIIMDGNRRWAKERGLPSVEGHRRGYETLKQCGDWCLARGIETLTVFAFSTENWKRAADEVSFLMDLLERAFRDEAEFFLQRGVRVRVLGRRDGLRPSVLRAIENIEERTKDNDKLTLAVCFNYGGRAELVDAVKSIAVEGISAEAIDEGTIAKRLYWPNMPDPDLVIRTSGEERLSGFLLWQCAYSEFYWSRGHWPAFSEAELDTALGAFAERQRRYGA